MSKRGVMQVVPEHAPPFQCIGCKKGFLHPPSEDDCPTGANGVCDILNKQGATSVWVKVLDPSARVHLFSTGAWLCRECVDRYMPKRKRVST